MGEEIAMAKAPGPTPPGYMLGQIELFGFDYAPQNFAACQGQLLPVSQNQQLFSLLGTNYGGNGTTTFALPKLAPATREGPFYFICTNGAFPERG
jgi:microcystin-dependent protein